jgi:hypothetical protein
MTISIGEWTGSVMSQGLPVRIAMYVGFLTDMGGQMGECRMTKGSWGSLLIGTRNKQIVGMIGASSEKTQRVVGFHPEGHHAQEYDPERGRFEV